MSDSPLLPWIAEPDKTPLTETLIDPVSEASITLPRFNGLTVNEVMFLNWSAENLKSLAKGLSNAPDVVIELTQFCHYFLCLRLEKADWNVDALVFEGPELKPSQTLKMGDGRSIPLYLMYLIYGFAVDEESRWLGKQNPKMLEAVRDVISSQLIGNESGEPSTGNSNESSQDTPDSAEKPLAVAPSTSSMGRSKASKKAA
jgi:hypothetical protein